MTRYFLPIVFAWLSLLVGLTYITNVGWTNTTKERETDWYAGYAYNLVEHGKYQDCTPETDSWHCATDLPDKAYRLPGYPLFLAGVMLVWPDHFIEATRLLQAVLLANITLLAVNLTARLFQSRSVTIIAGIFIVGSRWLNFHVGLIYTEILFIFLLMIFIYAILTSRHRGAGALWGISLVVRTSLMFAAPFLFLLIPRRRWLIVAVLMVAFSIPYAARNTLLFGEFVPTSTNGGINLYIGNNSYTYADGGYAYELWPLDPPLSEMDEIARDKELRRIGLRYIAHHWQDVPLGVLRKCAVVMQGEGWLVVLVWGLVGVLQWRKK